MAGIFTWSVDSALYQMEHGEPGTDRTYSAADYLQVKLQAGEPSRLLIGLRLLTMVERLRASD
jgi:hypothetical protein